MIAFERRASAVLYNAVRSRRERRPFLVPAAVCPAVPLTLVAAGAAVAFVDLDSELGIDRRRVLARLEEEGRYGGLIYVRPYGDERDPSPFFAAVRERAPDLLVIDDRCLARPDLDGSRLASGADLSLFSTSPRKQVDLGWGGFAHLAPGVRYRRHRRRFEPAAVQAIEAETRLALAEGRAVAGHVAPWLDLRAPPIEWPDFSRRVAALLDEELPARARLAAIYRRRIPKAAQFAEPLQGWRFNVLVAQPQRLISHLAAEGLFAGRHYACAAPLFGDGGNYPVADALHAAVVNLFVDRAYDEERARRTADLIAQHFEREMRGAEWPPRALRPSG